MAFILDNFTPASAHANSNSPRLWSYASATDSISDIEASGYFSAVSTQIQDGDMIMAQGSNGTTSLVVSGGGSTTGQPLAIADILKAIGDVEIITVTGNMTLSAAQSGRLYYVFIPDADGYTVKFDPAFYNGTDASVLYCVNFGAGSLTIEMVGEINTPQFLPVGAEIVQVCMAWANAGTNPVTNGPNARNGVSRRYARNFTADANLTLNADCQYQNFGFTDTGVVLTAGRDVIFPAGVELPNMVVSNGTAQILTFKVAGQTGVAVAGGAHDFLYFNGADLAAV